MNKQAQSVKTKSVSEATLKESSIGSVLFYLEIYIWCSGIEIWEGHPWRYQLTLGSLTLRDNIGKNIPEQPDDSREWNCQAALVISRRSIFRLWWTPKGFLTGHRGIFLYPWWVTPGHNFFEQNDPYYQHQFYFRQNNWLHCDRSRCLLDAMIQLNEGYDPDEVFLLHDAFLLLEISWTLAIPTRW